MGSKKGPKDRPNSNEDRKAYDAYFRERGLCPECKEHRPLVNGRRYCPECTKKKNELHKRVKNAQFQAHKCWICWKPLPEGYTFKTCEECMKRRKERYARKYGLMARQTYFYRAFSQRCTRCGRSLEDRDRHKDGSYMRMCYKCRLHASELWHRRKAARQS